MSDTGGQSAAFPPPPLKAAAEEVAALLKSRKQTIAVAETAAGGLVSAVLLTVPGASEFYCGGLTLYTLQSRIAYGGWTQDMITSYRGPTPEIVAGLAEHTRSVLKSDYVVSESGTAGPSGGNTKNRKPGFVCLAVATGKGSTTRELDTGLGGDRQGNMVAFAIAALELVRDVIRGSEKL
ncbi:competence/damage-inducible protein-like protein cinA [Hypoxylon crocopeplum]|nr:competence/damage-inducible protein-like protein cinA [Hypoxylon crocopeplum]